MNIIKVVRDDKTVELIKLPERVGDVGIDLYSAEDVIIEPGKTALVSTGTRIQLPPSFWMKIEDRSGLSKTLHVLAGIVDQSYTGIVKVRVLNHTDVSYKISKNDRIAQGILHKIWNTQQFSIEEVESLEKTDRAENGFGSSGK